MWFRSNMCSGSAQNHRTNQEKNERNVKDVTQSKAEHDFARATLTLHTSQKVPIYHWNREEV